MFLNVTICYVDIAEHLFLLYWFVKDMCGWIDVLILDAVHSLIVRISEEPDE